MLDLAPRAWGLEHSVRCAVESMRRTEAAAWRVQVLALALAFWAAEQTRWEWEAAAAEAPV